MTPLYFDKTKGGLTSRGNQLLECCCCDYCCGKFGTGGTNNPTVLTSSPMYWTGPPSGSTIFNFNKIDPQCPYPNYNNSPSNPGSYYNLFLRVGFDFGTTPPGMANLSFGGIPNLSLYCPNYYINEFLVAQSFGMSPYYLKDPVHGLTTAFIVPCGPNPNEYAISAQIIFGWSSGGPTGETPCSHIFAARFECKDDLPQVSIWKVSVNQLNGLDFPSV